jgi:uncharacterized OsmC-like protein
MWWDAALVLACGIGAQRAAAGGRRHARRCHGHGEAFCCPDGGGRVVVGSARPGYRRLNLTTPEATDMSSSTPSRMEFDVVSVRLSTQASQARCKQATITLDTDMAGNPQAFNPAELLLAALSACMIKGIERVTPILKFQLRGVEVKVHGVRQDVPPRLESKLRDRRRHRRTRPAAGPAARERAQVRHRLQHRGAWNGAVGHLASKDRPCMTRWIRR